MVPDTRGGMTFGHEVIGIGPSVENLKKGDMVIVETNSQSSGKREKRRS
jgi:D-arabinose 1-dehydrogenase-like Zn-dependent alcohol dehydrogenase